MPSFKCGIIIQGRTIYLSLSLVQREEHNLTELPGEVQKAVSQRLHSIANWTHGSINAKRWKAAARQAVQRAQEQAENESA